VVVVKVGLIIFWVDDGLLYLLGAPPVACFQYSAWVTVSVYLLAM